MDQKSWRQNNYKKMGRPLKDIFKKKDAATPLQWLGKTAKMLTFHKTDIAPERMVFTR
jgi:hypothetical protein